MQDLTAKRVEAIEARVERGNLALSEVMLAAADRMNVRGESLLSAIENAIDFDVRA